MREENARILVVDDEPAVVDFLMRALRPTSRKIKSFANAQSALDHAIRERPDLVVADVGLPGMSGTELSRRLLEADPELEIILISGDAPTVSGANLPGHVDWVAKPFQGPRLRWVAERALERHRLRRENRRLATELTLAPPVPLIGAHSPAIRVAMHRAEAFAKSHDMLLWISGETGVGKRSLVRWMHTMAGSGEAPLLLLEAHEARPERLEQLEEGTLVLMHAEAMPANFGQALLKRHEERAVERPSQEVKVVFLTEGESLPWARTSPHLGGLQRLLAAQHIDLPPLRRRNEDLFPLLNHHLRDWALRQGKPVPKIELGALRLLENHAWPGNAHEVRTLVARSLELHPPALTQSAVQQILGPSSEALVDLANLGPQTLEDIEKQVLRATLMATRGDKDAAARQLGISVRTLYRKMKAYHSFMGGIKIGAGSDESSE